MSRRPPMRAPLAPSFALFQLSRSLASRCRRSGGRLTQIRVALRFPAHRSYAVENEPARAKQERDEHYACREYRGWESRHEPCLEVGRDHRIRQRERDDGEDQCQTREKEKWPDFLEKIEDNPEDSRTVAECA